MGASEHVFEPLRRRDFAWLFRSPTSTPEAERPGKSDPKRRAQQRVTQDRRKALLVVFDAEKNHTTV